MNTTRNLVRLISSSPWCGSRANARWYTPRTLINHALKGRNPLIIIRRNYAVYKRFDQPQNSSKANLIDSSSNSNSYAYDRFIFNDQEPFNKIFNALPLWSWLLITSSLLYYLVHLEKIPQTGRWRFMDTSAQAEIATGEQIYIETLKKFRSKLLPNHHPTSQFITRVARKIIQASYDSKQNDRSSMNFNDDYGGDVTDWKIHVIDEPRIQNAFVIPGGKIFVFTGILPICKNESGLATVLGHEVAHQVLRHPVERMSSMKIIFILTGFLSILGLDPAICRNFVTLLMTLPNSRTSEIEADHIGLNIMASACYDPKEAVGVWKRMDKADHQSSSPFNNVTEFLQTHPTHDRRIQKIISWLPEAQNQRERKCGFTSQSFNQFNQWNPN